MRSFVRSLLWLPLALLASLVLAPLIWICFASLVPERTLFSNAAFSLSSLGLAHYQRLFALRGFARPLVNSLVVAGTTTLLCTLLGSAAAYALARLEFHGKKWVALLILTVSVFPQISIVEPLYALLREFGLINTYAGLVLSYLTFALPLTIFLLVSFFRGLPAEIEQAALLDGADRFQVFWHVIVPLSLPGVVSTAVVGFVYCWNEFLFALSFSVGPARQTLPVAVAMLRGRHQIPWGEMFAAAVIATLPVVGLVLVFQRRIVDGLAGGGSKG